MQLLDANPRAAQARPTAQPDPKPERPPAQGLLDPDRCRYCHRWIPWREPLDAGGWQEIHRCATWTVEAYASAAGEPPWQWRTSRAT